MEKLNLKRIYERHYKDKISYATFRTLFINNKDNFKNVEIIKFPRKTTYKILDEKDFIETFNKLINIEKI